MAGWASTSARRPSLQFSQEISKARTIVWNGPLGMFEKPAFAQGTLAMARAVAAATEAGATSIVGGGDSVAAVEQSGVAAPDFPHLDRRRRFARISRRRKIARRRSAHAKARRGFIAPSRNRRQLEDVQDAGGDARLLRRVSSPRRGIKALRHRRGAALYASLLPSQQAAHGTAIAIAAQNVHWAAAKAHSPEKSRRG